MPYKIYKHTFIDDDRRTKMIALQIDCSHQKESVWIFDLTLNKFLLSGNKTAITVPWSVFVLSLQFKIYKWVGK